MDLGILSDAADPCTDEEQPVFQINTLIFPTEHVGNPSHRKLISTVRFAAPFHLRVPFYFSFLFSDKKLAAHPGNFLVSLFTNTSACIICLFPM